MVANDSRRLGVLDDDPAVPITPPLAVTAGSGREREPASPMAGVDKEGRFAGRMFAGGTGRDSSASSTTTGAGVSPGARNESDPEPPSACSSLMTSSSSDPLLLLCAGADMTKCGFCL